jgi:hypothetical protein
MHLMNFLFFLFLLSSVNTVGPLLPGGSNYIWWNVTCPQQPCPHTGKECWQKFGALVTYHQQGVRSIVQSHLKSMYANGQRRLRFPIYHVHNAEPGTTWANSTGGRLHPQIEQNLQNVLDDIHTTGFVELIVGFFPLGPNDPTHWKEWKEDFYQENWNLIVNTRKLVKVFQEKSGMLVRFDLMNEGSAFSTYLQQRAYVKRLWIDYVLTYGKNDTIGFSLIGDPSGPDRVRTLFNDLQETGYGLPYLFDVHIYDDFMKQFIALHDQMVKLGDSNTPWILGETFYHSQQQKAEIIEAIKQRPSRTIFYVLQWPVSMGKGCDGNCDVAPPVHYIYGP